MSSDSDSDPDTRPRFRIRRHGTGSDSDDAAGPGGALAAGMLLGLMAAEHVRAIATGRPVRRRRHKRRRGKRRHDSVDEISMSDIDSPPTTLRSMHDSHPHHTPSQLPMLDDKQDDNAPPPPLHQPLANLSHTTDWVAAKRHDDGNGPLATSLRLAFSHVDAAHECKVTQIASGVYGRLGTEDICLKSPAYSPQQRAASGEWERRHLLHPPHDDAVLAPAHVVQCDDHCTQPSSPSDWHRLARRSGGLADICRL